MMKADQVSAQRAWGVIVIGANVIIVTGQLRSGL